MTEKNSGSPKKYVLGILASVLLLVGGCSYVMIQPYSEGYRDGVVQKFSHKGMFYKSFEGDLALPGSGRSTQSLGNVWHFSVTDQEIAKKIKDLQPGQEVRLYYEEYRWSMGTETNYRVNKLEVTKPR